MLGPLVVTTAEGPLALRGDVRRALLLRLLLNANRQISVNQLIADLWGDTPTPAGVSTLSSHIGLLRLHLGAERIKNHRGSYSLVLLEGELDADQFLTLVTDARTCARRGADTQAEACLRQAFALWRDVPYSEVAGAPWLEVERVRLAELFFEAEELQLEMAAVSGADASVVAQAKAAVTAHPEREVRWAIAMLALAQRGRHADALRIFQDLRAALAADGGLEPSPSLVSLEAAIAAHAPVLEAWRSLPLSSFAPSGAERSNSAGLPQTLLGTHTLLAGLDEDLLAEHERVARQALEAGDPVLAEGRFQRALAHLERNGSYDVRRRCDLLIGLGIAQRTSGDARYRDAIIQAGRLADDAGLPDLVIEAALASSIGLFSAVGHVDTERLALIDRALLLVADDDVAGRIRLLATKCSEIVYSAPLRARVSLAASVIDQARTLGQPDLLLFTLNSCSEALRHPTTLAERLTNTAAALALADGTDDPVATYWAHNFRWRTLMEDGQVAAARALMAPMAAAAEATKLPLARWLVSCSEAFWDLLDGRVDEGLERAQAAYKVGVELDRPDAILYFGDALDNALWQQGRQAEMIPALIDLTESRSSTGLIDIKVMRAQASSGQTAAAWDGLEVQIANDFAFAPDDFLSLVGLVELADAAITVGHSEAAQALFPTLLPFADQTSFSGTSCDGPIHLYLGGLARILEHYDVALAHLNAALRAEATTCSTYLCARTLAERGWTSALCGDDASAQVDLDQALAVARDGGCAGLVAALELSRTPR